MYLLVSNSRVIEEVSEVETAHERAVELAKKLKNDVQLVKVEGVAQHKIVFTPSKVEIPGPVEIKEVIAPAGEEKELTPVNVVENKNTETKQEQKTITEKVIEAKNKHEEEEQKQAFKDFVLVFNKALAETNSVNEHANICSEFHQQIETFNKNQKEMISSLKKENVKRVAVKDLSIELSNPSIKSKDDIDKILKRYPDNVKTHETIVKIVDSLTQEFKKESQESKITYISDEIFHKYLKDYETKLRTVDSFMDFDKLNEDFKELDLELSPEQNATIQALEKLNYQRIDNKLKEVLKPSQTIQELKAIDEEIPAMFDEKEFKEKCKEAFENAHTKSRLEEFRDHLLEENKEFDKFAKPIIFTSFYERLANLQSSKPKYVGV